MFIFLDIDGVMVPARSWARPELLNDGFAAFSSRSIDVLNSIITEDDTVMLTTSHKSSYTIDEWKDIFQNRGITVKKLQSLDKNVNHLNRKEEIMQWFLQNDVNEDIIIIDDDKSLNDLPPFLKSRLVLTSPLVGLNENHIEEIDSILNHRVEFA